MKTIMIYIGTATLFNAAALTGDVFIGLLAVLAGVMAWQHSKTLTIKPMQRGFEKEM
ncbi:MAG: hypothetical protein Q8K07_10455 [Methylicorpusculum sp.]|uniref:hypothetical protein n=1 Tax=Methylicorpusculum sp. TaxID=2713644 RepID=UPI002731992F|nr:hypothetical protein [Methylicorpusculum sp.]MDP2202429.1 hypothetical protein [Methylicorpusculum sp.]